MMSEGGEERSEAMSEAKQRVEGCKLLCCSSIREERRDSEERSDELKVLCFKRERQYTAVASLKPLLLSSPPRSASPL